ncbi:MAG: ABC transporter ATP-binding protein/permease [Synergistaceae bacterium]|jgi:ATP-binding cassette subfamily B protein|nr:ABC transporter ATP-binding protein/permease [Synergistaceae bacterium]
MIEKKRPIAMLWEISYGSRALYAASCAAMLASVFCGFLLPQVIRFVVDGVAGEAVMFGRAGFDSFAGALRENRGFAGLLVVCISAFGGVFNFIHRWTVAMGAEGLVERLRDRLYSHIQRLPYSWHTDIQTGDIIQRCTSDVDIVKNFFSTQITEIARAIVLVIFAYGILFPMNATLSAASFAFLPVILIYSLAFLRRATSRFLAADEAEGQLLAIAQENFSGVRVVRAFGRERHEIERFDRQNRHFAALWMKLGSLLGAYWGIGDLLTGLQMTTICALAAYQAAGDGITIGEFIVFLSYNSMIIWPVRGLGRVLSEAGKTGVSLGRIREILDTAPETDAADALETPIGGDIKFEGVSFSYSGIPVLSDVSFTVKRGTTLGILGATGSGKTTIAHLICRLYDLEDGNGKITIGGVDIRRYKWQWLRKNVGIVLQEPFLYSRSIRENIAPLPGYAPERITAAASAAHIDAEIEQFPHGYGTMVGERGVTLSGGQRQRVAIARMLLNGPPIMIFDDSLSAVDTETDARIRAALRRATGDATVIIITHRITSLSGADTVMVIKDGRVEEIGTPAELMELGGVYRRVRDMQQSAEDEIMKYSNGR